MLARLTDVDVPESRQALPERLSHWFSWTDAIALSAALDGAPSTSASTRAARSPGAEAAEVARLRAALAQAIADSGVAADASADFAPLRRRYQAQQQAMEAGIGPVRARLRAALSARSAALARLADVDAVMEQVLGVHERSLLATVPRLLEKHFERLCQHDGSAAWLNAFGEDLRSVLLAELDIRLQPLECLLEVLATPPPRHP